MLTHSTTQVVEVEVAARAEEVVAAEEVAVVEEAVEKLAQERAPVLALDQE